MNNLTRKIHIIVEALIICFLFFSCSTEKNTALSVAFHNMTAHYNIHFNGYESFQKAITKLEESHEDNYNQILPVYIVPDENNAGSIAPNLDRTQKKALKVIELHSIKAKREYKKGEISPKQREYLKKNEYNKWVDDAYLLIGLTYFYQLNFSLSLETFRFMLREFENEPVIIETRLWMAKAFIEEEEYSEALNILIDIGSKREVNDKIKSEINATFAQYYIYQEEYGNAIKKLVKALEKPGSKTNKMRYTYILAQLYQKTGDKAKAYDMFEKVIKMNPPYEMTFNAKISMAGSFEKGYVNSENILEQLHKMLKDDKNIDFRDQIYYAIANIYFTDGDKKSAIENYKLSAGFSVDNVKQKARTYITLADIFYEEPDYVEAQAYYDSAFTIIDPDFKNYDIIEAKSKNLNELVASIKAVELQDSLQYLASLNNSELLSVIDNIIAEVVESEEITRQKEQRRLQDIQLNAANNPGTTASKTGSWYFYNPTAKSFGQREFKTKWGNRKLEDNWRRKNKKVSVYDETIFDNEEQIGDKKKDLSNKTREYYLQDIPLTDSALTVSHNIIKEGLVNIGLIYRNQFNEIELSVNAFQDLIRRYPDDNITLNAYYNLYLIYKDTNPSKSNTYRNIIITKYPDSKFAKVLTDPDYFKEIEKQEREGQIYYENTYALFIQERYNEVINNVNIALLKYTDQELVPKFRYLKTLSIGKVSDPGSFRKALNEFINQPDNGDLISNAQKVLSYLDNANPDVKQVQEEEIALEMYNHAQDKEYYIIIAVSKGSNVNQLEFNIINFNLDAYDDLNLEINKIDFDDENIFVKIDKFTEEKAAIKYLENLNKNQDIFKDVNAVKIEKLFISSGNYNKLIKDKNLNRYLIFMEENY